ncbi:MAG: DMT family transporter [Acidobacteria bacterium]|nr:DMT family transporter [Acidobacteriota bacterium]
MKSGFGGIWWVVAAALLWSSGGLGIKSVADPALKVAFYRSAIAAVVLFAIFRPRAVRWTVPFLTAIGSYAICLTTFVLATKMTTAANAIFLQYSGVVWVLVASPLVLKETLRRRDAIACTVAIGGMALFFIGRFGGGTMAGNLMGLVSGIFFAILVVALRFERGAGAEAAVTWGNVLVAVALFPFVFDDLAVTPVSLGWLLFLGVFQIALAYACFVKGLESVTATAASLTGMIEPVSNPVWVFLVLGERPSPWAIAGGVIVLAAIAWRTIETGPPHRRKVAPPD